MKDRNHKILQQTGPFLEADNRISKDKLQAPNIGGKG